MLHTGVARTVLTWVESRRYFYQRLRRRLAEVYVERRLSEANPNLSMAERKALIAQTFKLAQDASDAAAADVLEQGSAKVEELVMAAKEQALVAQLQGLSTEARARIAASLS